MTDRQEHETSSVVVCGTPRGGTSMLANLLADAGLTTADHLIPATASNPHGFGEDIRINRLNDHVLERLESVSGAPDLPRSLWWLGSYDRAASETEAVDPALVRQVVPTAPFVVKDPRFSHTFPAWRPLLGDAVKLVMVRSAGEVATSVLRMAAREPGYFDGWCGDAAAVRGVVGSAWTSTYRAVLSWADESTFFIRHGELVDRPVLAGLGRLLNRTLTSTTIDPTLSTSEAMSGVEVETNVADAVTGRLILDRSRLVRP